MIDFILSGGWILFVCVCGPVMIFQTPLRDNSPKRKPAKKAKTTKRKTKTAKPAKAKTKKKAWAKMHKVDAAEAQRVEEMFRRGRGLKFDDTWI